MAKRLKKANVLILTIILLSILGAMNYKSLIDLTGFISVDPVQTNLASEEDIRLYDLAIESSDESICMQIKFADFQYDCLEKVAEDLEDENVCLMINDVKSQGSCFTELSLIKNDVTICKNVEKDDYWNDICYKNYAINNNDGWYCLFVNKGINSNPCYYEVAVNTNDYELCKEVTISETYDRCNYEISKSTQTIEPCFEMNEPLNTDVCVLRLAKSKEDSTICENIKFFSEIKTDCYAQFSE